MFEPVVELPGIELDPVYVHQAVAGAGRMSVWGAMATGNERETANAFTLFPSHLRVQPPSTPSSSAACWARSRLWTRWPTSLA